MADGYKGAAKTGAKQDGRSCMKRKIRRYLNSRISTKRVLKKPETARYIGLIVFLCFLAGIFCANQIGAQTLGSFGIWNTYFIEKFKYARIQSADLFYHVLKTRMPLLLFLLVLSMTGWGQAAGTAFLAWQGFAGGFLITASVMAYGAKGILLILTAILPQYLLYIPVYLSYLSLASFWKTRVVVADGGKAGRMRGYLLFASLCLCMVSIYLTGIFLESYVNPFLLKKILNIF